MSLGSETRHLVERQFRTGRDDQVIVGNGRAVIQLDAVLLRVHLPGAFRLQRNAAALEHGGEVDGDVVAVTPADRDPGVGWYEGIGCAEVDDGEAVLAAQLVTHLIGHDGATEPGAEHDDMRHGVPPAVSFLALS